MFGERKNGPISASDIEANRVAILALRELLDSKINTLRFELVTGLATLKELKQHDLERLDEKHALVTEEIKRRLSELDSAIDKLDTANRDYVLRVVYEKDSERLYTERRESLAARENGRRAMTLALISGVVSIFSIAVTIALHFLK